MASENRRTSFVAPDICTEKSAALSFAVTLPAKKDDLASRTQTGANYGGSVSAHDS